MTNIITEALDTLTESAANNVRVLTAIKDDKIKFARDLIIFRTGLLIGERLDGDDKGARINDAIDVLKNVHGPIVVREMDKSVDRTIDAIRHD